MAVSYRFILPVLAALGLASAGCSDIQSVRYPIRERDGSLVQVSKYYGSVFSNDAGDTSFKQIQAGRIDDALATIRGAAESEPGQSMWHYDLAIVFEIKNRWPDALAEIKIARRIAPLDNRYHNEEGFILRHMQ